MKLLLSLIIACLTFLSSKAQFVASGIGRFSYTKYVDTIPPLYYSETPLTLKIANGGGTGSATHPDTILVYNHFGYMKRCVEKEIDYWVKVSDDEYARYEKTNDYRYFRQHITAARRIEYWNGVRDGIGLILYQGYDHVNFSYDFKTNPKIDR